MVFLIFRISWLKKEKELSQKRGQRVKLQPLNPEQKRSWYRLRTNTEFKWVLASEYSSHKKINYKNDYLVDISGGGLCFKTAEILNIGDVIRLVLDIGADKKLSAYGTVLRVEKENRQNNETRYKVSIQFEGLSRRELDSIVSFIMNRQRYFIKDQKSR